MRGLWAEVDANFHRPEVFEFCVLCGRICLFVPFFVVMPLYATGFENLAARLLDFVAVTALAGLIAIFYHPIRDYFGSRLP